MDFCCPRCNVPLDSRSSAPTCPQCSEEYFERDGIRMLITARRREQIAPFLAQYAAVRRAEGRGNRDREYLLTLPNVGEREWALRRRSSRVLLAAIASQVASRAPSTVSILDVGAGNCWLTRLLAERGYDVAALDLFTDVSDGLGAGGHYLEALPIRFERVAAHFDELPLRNRSVDVVIFNASLHYSADITKTLTEALRVIRRDGAVYICDSPVYRSASAGAQMRTEREAYYRSITGESLDTEQSSFIATDDLPRWERTLGVSVRWIPVNYGFRAALGRLRTRMVRGREGATMGVMCVRLRPDTGAPTPPGVSQ